MMKRIAFALLCIAMVGCAGPSGTTTAPNDRPDNTATRPAPPIKQASHGAVARTEKLLTDLAEAERFDRQKVEAAYDEFQRIVTAEPQLFMAHLALVETAATLGRLKQLEPWYLDKIKGDPNTAGWFFGLARAQQASPAMQRTVDKTTPLNIALQLAPAQPEVLLLKADMLRYSRGLKPEQQRVEAMKAYRDVLRVEPDNARALFGLAVLEFDVRPSGPQSAVDHLKRAIESFRPWERGLKWEALMTLGGMLREMNRNEQALEAYEKAEALSFASTWARFDRAALLWQMGRKDEALALWKEARGKLMLGSPTGLKLFRHVEVMARGGTAWANLLPQGSMSDYQTLVTRFGTDTLRPTLAVPQADMVHLAPGLGAYLRESSGTLTAWVQAREKDVYSRQLILAESVVTLLDDGKQVLSAATGFDHILSIRLHDVDGDGSPELLAAGISNLNALKLNVYRKTDAGGWKLAFQLSADCLTPSSGFVLANLDDDPSQEIVKVEGPDNWPTVYKLTDAGLADVSRKHPAFYDYFRATVVPQEAAYVDRLNKGRGDARLLRTVLAHIQQIKTWDKTD